MSEDINEDVVAERRGRSFDAGKVILMAIRQSQLDCCTWKLEVQEQLAAEIGDALIEATLLIEEYERAKAS